MTPTTLPVQPATPAAQPVASATAPTAAPADFMALLGQLAGAAGPTAPDTPASPILTATTSDTDDEPVAIEGVDVAGLLAMPLPVMPTQLQAPAVVSGGLKEAIQSAIGAPASRSAAVAPEAQLLSDLIQGEQQQPTGLDAPTSMESASLPVTSDVSSKATQLSPTDQIISRHVHAPVGSAAWADEIGSRLTLMAEHGKHTASIRLSPEHLGPLEIHIDMKDDQASVWFGAAHADTRAAIETALPRLRELFASQGLLLTDAGVSHEAPRQHREQPPAAPSTSGAAGSEDDASARVSRHLKLGLIDAYA